MSRQREAPARTGREVCSLVWSSPDWFAVVRTRRNVENPMRFDDSMKPIQDKQTMHAFAVSALNRRKLLRGIGALGAVALAGSRLSWVAAQDSTASPTPPKVGKQPDGTALWRVQVAGGAMDDGIELMGFY